VAQYLIAELVQPTTSSTDHQACRISMSDSKVSMWQLTTYTLNDHNWQLWRKEVIISMKCINDYDIMVGAEKRPSQGAASQSQELRQPQQELQRLTDATMAQHTAKQNAQADPDDEKLQKELQRLKEEHEQASSEYARAAVEPKPLLVTASSSTDPKTVDWDRRHDQAYRLLQMSLGDAYKELTFECASLPPTWLKLKNHFESRAGADIMAGG
jgi:hypothetical protein